MIGSLITWLQGKKTIGALGVGAILSIALAAGYLTPEQNDALFAALRQAYDHTVGLLSAIAFIAGILAKLGSLRSEKKINLLIEQTKPAEQTQGEPTKAIGFVPLALVLMLGGSLLAGCGGGANGVTMGFGSISKETPTYVLTASVQPDSTSDTLHVQTRYSRKDGTVPNVTLTRPDPNTVQADFWAPLSTPSAQKALRIINPPEK